jgi:hypothetical protein
MKQGIILIALGHPYYAQLAVNLVMSIKHNQPDMPITLFHDKHSIAGIPEDKRRYFDAFGEVEDDFYIIAGKKHFGLMKTKMNQLAARTDYDHVLYIDVDSLAIPGTNLNKFFETTAVAGFATEFRGTINLTTAPANTKIGGWLACGHVKGKFALKDANIPSYTQSSWIGFDKNSDEVNEIFTEAENMFHYFMKLGNAALWYNSVPDELCFALSMGITGFPIVRDLDLCYYETSSFMPDKKRIMTEFALFTLPSAGGHRQNYAEFYNHLVNKIANEAQWHRATQWKDKRKLSRDPQRKNTAPSFIQTLRR